MNTFGAVDAYLNLLLDNPNIDPYTVLSVFFLTIARLLPLMALTPFLGGQNVPMTIRMMFAVSLATLFFPANLLNTHESIHFTMLFVGLMLKELIIGAFLGFLSTIPFYIVQMSGGLIDFQRGASSLQVTDPSTRTQTGAIGVLYNYVLIALFFSFGGPIFFFNGVASSYEAIPVASVINPDIFYLKHSLWQMVIGLAQRVFAISIQLASPSLIGILLMDMFLGIANRMAPQVQIVFLGIPLKSWVGIALLAAAWGLTIQVMTKETLDWFKMIEKFVLKTPVT